MYRSGEVNQGFSFSWQLAVFSFGFITYIFKAYLLMGDFNDLLVYKKSFELAMAIFEISKSFPKEETYSLTDQIRRSSRSTNICFVEAYRKRRYKAHFVNKLTDRYGKQ